MGLSDPNIVAAQEDGRSFRVLFRSSRNVSEKRSQETLGLGTRHMLSNLKFLTRTHCYFQHMLNYVAEPVTLLEAAPARRAAAASV